MAMKGGGEGHPGKKTRWGDPGGPDGRGGGDGRDGLDGGGGREGGRGEKIVSMKERKLGTGN